MSLACRATARMVPVLLVLVGLVADAGCDRRTLDEAQAGAALRGHARFSQPLVIGLPLESSTRPGVPSAIVASDLLMARGDVTIEQADPLQLRLTDRGRDLLGTAGWAVTGGSVAPTLSVPIAGRELVRITAIESSEPGWIVAFDWRWSMTEIGQELRDAGVRLEDWGLRIDDRHMFRGGAQLTLVGDRWDIRITRPPDSPVD